jgi:transcriptional regulator with XRE-family HTH domain
MKAPRVEMMKRDISGAQLRAARALLNLSMDDVARLAGVHKNTVFRLENDGQSYSHAAASIVRALEEAGVEFTLTGVQVQKSAGK